MEVPENLMRRGRASELSSAHRCSQAKCQLVHGMYATLTFQNCGGSEPYARSFIKLCRRLRRILFIKIS